MQTLNPDQLIDFLLAVIPARMPILIVGAPGIGKSACTDQAIERLGWHSVLSHPSVADPTDFKGIPFAADGRASFLPLGQMSELLEATEPTVWVIDDLGQATPAVQAGLMQWILARECAGHKLPDCVSIVACTNRRTDRAGVSGILEPVKSRFFSIVELVPDLDCTCRYAFDHGWPEEEIAYIRFRPDRLCAFEPSADLTNSPLPRTWAHLAELSKLGLTGAVELAAFSGAVGEGDAGEYLAFRKMAREAPSPDGIILDPDASAIPENRSVLYAVVTALGIRATETNFPRIARYAERLTDAKHGEFAALLLRDVARKIPTVCQSPSFVRLASGELGDLISG